MISKHLARGVPVERSPVPRISLLLFALLVSCVAPSAAQSPESRPSYEFVFENDIFVGAVPGRPHSDREYTNGVWLATERSGAPAWGGLLPSIPGCGDVETTGRTCLRTRFELGQKIYTPFIQANPPPSGERPYAGWLYVAAVGRVVRPVNARSLRVEVGVTGAPSLAEEVQKLIHVLTSYPEPVGWDYQIPFEPGVHVNYEESRLLDVLVPDGRRIADVVLAADLSVGNVRTAVRGSVKARAGYRLPHPWIRAAGSGRFGIFGEAEYRRQWVARDIFLDRPPGGGGAGVERIPTTDEWRYAVAVDYRDVRLRFTWVLEDRLYESQPKPHRYGSLALILRP